MYRFVYDVLYKEYTEFNSVGRETSSSVSKTVDNNFKIHYSDTDSLIVELLNNEKLEKIKEYLHKSELGKFSDECPDHNILKFIALKSKMYAMIKQNKITGKLEVHKKSKGIPGSQMKNINYETLKDIILNSKKHEVKYYKLHPKKHEIFLEKFNKKGLSCFDDKNYILSDGIHTLPYRNKKIKLIENLDETNNKLNNVFPLNHSPQISDLNIYKLDLNILYV